MKRLIIMTLCLAVIAGVALLSEAQANAQATEMSAEHVTRIRENCVSAQSTLRQMLDNSDTPLRVNRGQLYAFISQKLMVPLNNRLATSGYDTIREVTIVNNFQTDVNTFKFNYLAYRDSLTQAISMKCTDQPVSFYDSVADAREKRARVHDSIDKINMRLKEYKDEVDQFTKALKEQSV